MSSILSAFPWNDKHYVPSLGFLILFLFIHLWLPVHNYAWDYILICFDWFIKVHNFEEHVCRYSLKKTERTQFQVGTTWQKRFLQSETLLVIRNFCFPIWPPETQRTGCRINWDRLTICGLEGQFALSWTSTVCRAFKTASTLCFHTWKWNCCCHFSTFLGGTSSK